MMLLPHQVQKTVKFYVSLTCKIPMSFRAHQIRDEYIKINFRPTPLTTTQELFRAFCIYFRIRDREYFERLDAPKFNKFDIYIIRELVDELEKSTRKAENLLLDVLKPTKLKPVYRKENRPELHYGIHGNHEGVIEMWFQIHGNSI